MRLINSDHHYGSIFFFKKFTDALFSLVLMFANNLHAIVVVQVSFMLLAFDQQICMTKKKTPLASSKFPVIGAAHSGTEKQ